MNKININNFDFLRVVFATTVALSHLIRLSEVEMFQSYGMLFNARLAIDGFFVISGFLIAKSYENSKTPKEYIFKRVRRIVPAYAFLVLFCAVSFCLISKNSVENYFLSGQFWKYLGANLTFQNYIEPCLPGVFENNAICAVNGALWTIKVEEAFYLLVPFFYFIIKFKKSNIYVLSIIVYLISITYFNYFVSIDMYRIAKQLPGALAFFVMGIMLYKNFDFFQKWKHYIILPCLVLFFIEQYLFKTYILKPIVFGFMVFYIAYNFKWLNNFGKYGDFTYGIYIYHFPVIQIFVYFKLFNKYDPIIISLVVFLIVLILAVLSWYILELRYLSKSRRERQKIII
ncbi:acyltransferase [Flavivirga sp. 57AJ16]|uniref:acyltransferase family protein n=1 Tax=Flavivirga sp. 57AJ16 TaxID=3025307 RepID=UPI002366B015|nr:acyltransferase [Flavivirga sp. 57AJ16]MDD7887141.1 acyltransferase [Flavivirga sp. 57AJ16]